METTFISIHDLSLDARLLYTSHSIVDILGYTSQEVVGKSCWEYFHPDEIPFARAIHGRGVQLDKAAVLNYCQIKNRNGRWVGCEGVNSQKRATVAPVIRRLFSSSPQDPRYHMLSYISNKFAQEIPRNIHEPRAALFLNRFTRTLTIMYATNGLADILGITAEELNGKSFYYCIQENCLKEAIKCLESAKANDSIAYLRFWFRDPRQDDPPDGDERMTDGNSSGDEDEGGVHLNELMDEDGSENAVTTGSSNTGSSRGASSTERSSVEPDYNAHAQPNNVDPNSRSSSGNSTDLGGNSTEAIFDRPAPAQSSSSSFSLPSPERDMPSFQQCQIELEAVVSCASDGLVVVLRKARPTIPQIPGPAAEPVEHPYRNGLFASPWATEPHMPPPPQTPLYAQHNSYQPSAALGSTTDQAGVPTVQPTQGPATSTDFMNTIREVAVFAWALTGINGSLSQYSRGKPSGESQPPQGMPVWSARPNAGPMAEQMDESNAYFNDNIPREPYEHYRDDRRHNQHDSHGGWPQEPYAYHQQQQMVPTEINGHSSRFDNHNSRYTMPGHHR
ncbi:MAG: hypothetical protein Q9169_003201 [Polycauliona sp. 2 TL-2023]